MATRVVFIEFDTNLGSLTTDFAAAGRSADQLSFDFKQLDERQDQLGRSADRLGDRQDRLRHSMRGGGAGAGMQGAERELVGIQRAVNRTEKAVQGLQTETRQTGDVFRSTSRRSIDSMDDIRRSTSRVNNELAEGQRRARSFGASVAQASASASKTSAQHSGPISAVLASAPGGADGSIGRLQTYFGTLGRLTGAFFAAQFAISAFTIAISAIGRGVGAFVMGGSNMIETLNKVKESVQGQIPSFTYLTSEADRLGKSLGINKREFLDAASSITLIGRSAGLSIPLAAQLGSNLAELAADVSSFYNIPVEDALIKIRAGLVGQTRPLRELGVLIDVATTKQFAYRRGIAAVGEELTQQQKVQARAIMIQEQLATASGDLVRTQDELANKFRAIRGHIQNWITDIGIGLNPHIKALLDSLYNLGQGALPFVQGAFDGIADALHRLGPFFSGLRDSISNVVDILGTAIEAVAPFAQALGGIVGGAAIVALNTFATALSGITGFLAENEGLVKVLANALGLLLIPRLFELARAFTGGIFTRGAGFFTALTTGARGFASVFGSSTVAATARAEQSMMGFARAANTALLSASTGATATGASIGKSLASGFKVAELQAIESNIRFKALMKGMTAAQSAATAREATRGLDDYGSPTRRLRVPVGESLLGSITGRPRPSIYDVGDAATVRNSADNFENLYKQGNRSALAASAVGRGFSTAAAGVKTFGAALGTVAGPLSIAVIAFGFLNEGLRKITGEAERAEHRLERLSTFKGDKLAGEFDSITASSFGMINSGIEDWSDRLIAKLPAGAKGKGIFDFFLSGTPIQSIGEHFNIFNTKIESQKKKFTELAQSNEVAAERIIAAERKKGREVGHLEKALADVRKNNVQAARDQEEQARRSADKAAGEAAKILGTSPEQVKALAGSLGVDLAQGADQAADAISKATIEIEEIGSASGRSGEFFIHAMDDNIDKAKEFAKEMEDAAQKASEAFLKDFDVFSKLGGQDDFLGLKAIKGEDTGGSSGSSGADKSADSSQRIENSQRSQANAADALARAQRRLNDLQNDRKPAKTIEEIQDRQNALASATEAVERAQRGVEAAADGAGTAQRKAAGAGESSASETKKAFEATASSIQQFYKAALLEGEKFTSNLQTAIGMGLDPNFIARAMQAGPEQAGPIIEAIVSDTSKSTIDIINTGETALKKWASVTAETARLTHLATTSESDTMVKDLDLAIKIAQANWASGGTATVQQIAASAKTTEAEVGRVAAAFGQSLSGINEKALQEVRSSGKNVLDAQAEIEKGLREARGKEALKDASFRLAGDFTTVFDPGKKKFVDDRKMAETEIDEFTKGITAKYRTTGLRAIRELERDFGPVAAKQIQDSLVKSLEATDPEAAMKLRLLFDQASAFKDIDLFARQVAGRLPGALTEAQSADIDRFGEVFAVGSKAAITGLTNRLIADFGPEDGLKVLRNVKKNLEARGESTVNIDFAISTALLERKLMRRATDIAKSFKDTISKPERATLGRLQDDLLTGDDEAARKDVSKIFRDLGPQEAREVLKVWVQDLKDAGRDAESVKLGHLIDVEDAKIKAKQSAKEIVKDFFGEAKNEVQRQKFGQLATALTDIEFSTASGNKANVANTVAKAIEVLEAGGESPEAARKKVNDLIKARADALLLSTKPEDRTLAVKLRLLVTAEEEVNLPSAGGAIDRARAEIKKHLESGMGGAGLSVRGYIKSWGGDISNAGEAALKQFEDAVASGSDKAVKSAYTVVKREFPGQAENIGRYIEGVLKSQGDISPSYTVKNIIDQDQWNQKLNQAVDEVTFTFGEGLHRKGPAAVEKFAEAIRSESPAQMERAKQALIDAFGQEKADAIIASMEGRLRTAAEQHPPIDLNFDINVKIAAWDAHFNWLPGTTGNILASVAGAAASGAEGMLALGSTPRDSRDQSDNHIPEIDRSAKYRIWAEPETGGELYAPLANDYRRPRAIELMKQAAGIFGYQMIPKDAEVSDIVQSPAVVKATKSLKEPDLKPIKESSSRPIEVDHPGERYAAGGIRMHSQVDWQPPQEGIAHLGRAAAEAVKPGLQTRIEDETITWLSNLKIWFEAAKKATAGAAGPGAMGAAVGAGYQLLIDYLKSANVPHSVTSTIRPGAITKSGHLSNHAVGRAVDFAGPDMMSIFNSFIQVYRQLAELFYDPAGRSVKDRAIVPWTIGGHSDHVHAAVPPDVKQLGNVQNVSRGNRVAEGGIFITVPAMAGGGVVDKPTLILAGEKGPEAVVPLAQGGLRRPQVGSQDDDEPPRTSQLWKTLQQRGGLWPFVSAARKSAQRSGRPEQGVPDEVPDDGGVHRRRFIGQATKTLDALRDTMGDKGRKALDRLSDALHDGSKKAMDKAHDSLVSAWDSGKANDVIFQMGDRLRSASLESGAFQLGFKVNSDLTLGAFNLRAADGKTIKVAAQGGLEDHSPQIAQGGPIRIWAEPETHWEAYIPGAPDRRPRAVAITAEVADRFGYALTPKREVTKERHIEKFAEGGITATSQLGFANAGGPGEVATGLGGLSVDQAAKSIANYGIELAVAFEDFTKKLQGQEFSSPDGPVSGDLAGWIGAAMAITGVPLAWLQPLATIAKHESGGNAKSINLWDSNAQRGDPSRGLFQTIGSTFRAHRLPGMDDIWNPVHNAVAAIRYIIGRYGTVYNVPGIKALREGGHYRGYAEGGIQEPTEEQAAPVFPSLWADEPGKVEKPLTPRPIISRPRPQGDGLPAAPGIARDARHQPVRSDSVPLDGYGVSRSHVGFRSQRQDVPQKELLDVAQVPQRQVGWVAAQLAAGGVEDHSPQIANGAWPHRVWAEPETGWEAYIPGADDHRRSRAVAITAEVADRFGFTLLPKDAAKQLTMLAEGGVVDVKVGRPDAKVHMPSPEDVHLPGQQVKVTQDGPIVRRKYAGGGIDPVDRLMPSTAQHLLHITEVSTLFERSEQFEREADRKRSGLQRDHLRFQQLLRRHQGNLRDAANEEVLNLTRPIVPPVAPVVPIPPGPPVVALPQPSWQNPPAPQVVQAAAGMLALPPGAPSPRLAMTSIMATIKNASPGRILHKLLLEGAQAQRPPQETVRSSQVASAPDLRWAFGPGRTDQRRSDEVREEGATRDIQLGRFDFSKYVFAQGAVGSPAGFSPVNVRVAVADQGGTIEPGWNLTYNGLGKSELVVPPRDRKTAPSMLAGPVRAMPGGNTTIVHAEVSIPVDHIGGDVTLAQVEATANRVVTTFARDLKSHISRGTN